MGLGLVEPVDDWSEARPSHPELLDYLARQFVIEGYDLKALARLVFSSQAYQRRPLRSLPGDPGARGRLFAGPARRRLSAEQVVDSLYRAAGKRFDCEELNLNTAGDRPPEQFLDLGRPARAWEFTALSNERDRPALALPIAQSIVDVLCAFGWRQSRQNQTTVRDDAASPLQALLLANGTMASRIVRLSDDSDLTRLCLEERPLEELVREVFLRLLTRPPSGEEAGPRLRAVFQLEGEPAGLREEYGGEFGQRCLLARRLVEAGVRFVEVSFNLNFLNGTGWDTHNEGQLKQHLLIQDLDRALSTLLRDLERRQLLSRTLVVVATEFGRPPEFDSGGGRGHQSRAFSALLAGGGLRSGRVVGATDDLGKTVTERPVSIPEFHATLHWALGIDSAKELYAGDRPVPITDRGRPIAELFS